MDKILVVDDEKAVCYSFKKILNRHGYDVTTANNGVEAIEKAGSDEPDLIIMDISMPEMDGLETLEKLKSAHPSLTIIMMTAHSTSEKAITAMKHGAYDYLVKPFDNDDMLSLVQKAIIDKKITTPVTFKETEEDAGDRIIGRSPAMLEIFKKIGQVAVTDVTVLLRGETGTGKELVARAIYQHSDRVNKPFLPVNCAAIPDNLLESELFGNEKGAFTGADRQKIGKFEQADGGTMFLDEIGDMPLALQAKLLRVLQDGTFQRLGGKDTVNTDVRIIAATNKNIEDLQKKDSFRDDLYWRLNVVSITIPPLRDRRSDIEKITNYFIHRFNKDPRKDIKGISPELLKEFQEYSWPGNVRELQSVIHRAIVLCQKDVISLEDCESFKQAGSNDEGRAHINEMLSDAAALLLKQAGSSIYKDAVSSFERRLISKALELTDNNQVLAAKLLGISRNTLRSKIHSD